jgi:predicted nucleic acid-binding protein
MASEAFIDSSGFYALLVKDDDQHAKAMSFMRSAAKKARGFVTTDYVLDETATLLQAREREHVVPAFFESIFASRVCQIVWMDPQRFEQSRTFCLKHLGRKWSFTDCTSFVVMKELRLKEALTKDRHFQAAGFTPLLA